MEKFFKMSGKENIVPENYFCPKMECGDLFLSQKNAFSRDSIFR